jgi:hypothetical protein
MLLQAPCPAFHRANIAARAPQVPSTAVAVDVDIARHQWRGGSRGGFSSSRLALDVQHGHLMSGGR